MKRSTGYVALLHYSILHLATFSGPSSAKRNYDVVLSPFAITNYSFRVANETAASLNLDRMLATPLVLRIMHHKKLKILRM